MDLDAYLARIHWGGHEAAPLAPDMHTLRALAAHHAAAIPFENLNPFLGLPVPLEPEAIERKLVHEHRGGYCFEHNLLLAQVLRRVGFEVGGLAARVMWNRPEDALTPRSHMLLRVKLQGPAPDAGDWLVDLGFGGLTLTGALRLQPDIEQPTPHEPFRLLRADDEWRMQALVRGEWKLLYRFDLQHQHALDYEAMNLWVSTHPASIFTTTLMAARALPDRRLALRNDEFVVHPRGGDSLRQTIASVDELVQVLQRDFGIRLPDAGALRSRLQTLFD